MIEFVVVAVGRLWKTPFSKACVKVEGGGLGASFAQAVRRPTRPPCGKVGLGGGASFPQGGRRRVGKYDQAGAIAGSRWNTWSRWLLQARKGSDAVDRRSLGSSPSTSKVAASRIPPLEPERLLEDKLG